MSRPDEGIRVIDKRAISAGLGPCHPLEPGSVAAWENHNAGGNVYMASCGSSPDGCVYWCSACGAILEDPFNEWKVPAVAPLSRTDLPPLEGVLLSNTVLPTPDALRVIHRELDALISRGDKGRRS